jgi:hypothetical protein
MNEGTSTTGARGEIIVGGCALELLPPRRSRVVRAAGYDEEGALLALQLKGERGRPSGVFRYVGVPEHQHTALVESARPDAYLAEAIFPAYHCERFVERFGLWVAVGRCDGRPDRVYLPLPGVRELSARESYYGVLRWHASDVRAVFARRGRRISLRAAEAWLLANEGALVDRLIEQGHEVMDAMIPAGGGR